MRDKGLFSAGYALLIGVGETTDPDWSLPSTVTDVMALRDVLVDPAGGGYPNDPNHVKVLWDSTATRRGILEGLIWLEGVAKQDSEITALVHFSGHGRLVDDEGEYYLIPHDTGKDIPRTALDIRAFAVHLRRIRARRLLVILDSCYSGGWVSSRSAGGTGTSANSVAAALPEPAIHILKHGSGRVIFASSSGRQKSWQRPDGSMGIYTHRLVEALRGTATPAGETAVRVSHLMQHLAATVPADAQAFHGAEQIPQFDMASEDFAVAARAAVQESEVRRRSRRQEAGTRSTGVCFTGKGNVSIRGDVVGGDQEKRR